MSHVMTKQCFVKSNKRCGPRRMIEVWSEPAGALTDLAMAQWEEASVVTVRGNVAAEGAATIAHPPSKICPRRLYVQCCTSPPAAPICTARYVSTCGISYEGD
jgi:hypothetical protein